MSFRPERLLVWHTLDSAVQQALEVLVLRFQPYSQEGLSNDWDFSLTVDEQWQLKHHSVWELPDQLVFHASSDAALLDHSEYDFKYFLPRRLLRALHDQNLTEVLSHARAVGLASWPEVEQEAIRVTLQSWWTQCLKQPIDFNSWPVEDALCALALLELDLSPFLNEWQSNTGLNASLHLIETIRFLFAQHEDILCLEGAWEDCPVQAEQLKSWLLGTEVLERVQRVQGALQWVNHQGERQLVAETVQRLVNARRE